MVGQTVAHYRIDSKLGEGGMGVVYKAWDTHLDRFVAIKVLPQAIRADAERQRRFVQEAKAASALNHPNILHVYALVSQTLGYASTTRPSDLRDLVEPFRELIQQQDPPWHRVPEDPINLLATDGPDDENLEIVDVHRRGPGAHRKCVRTR